MCIVLTLVKGIRMGCSGTWNQICMGGTSMNYMCRTSIDSYVTYFGLVLGLIYLSSGEI